MKVIIALVICGLAIIQATPLTGIDGKCEPHSTFMHPDGCNKCFCGDNGLAVCTLMECLQKIPIGVKASSSQINKKDLCTPGEVFEIAGLKCECKEIPHGISWTCKGHKIAVGVKASSSQLKCEPGTSYKVDCNTCFCTETGIAACTEMGCLTTDEENSKPIRVLDPEAKDFSCIPFEFFNHIDGCNTCSCSNDGKMAICTRMGCPTEIEDNSKPIRVLDPLAKDFSCMPHEFFKHIDGCNTCTCMDNGKMAACTRMGCPPKLEARSKPIRVLDPLAKDFKCVPHEFFKHIDGCNTCTCMDNGKMAACTRMGCVTTALKVLDPTAKDFRCTPHESFMHIDGCNTCACMDNGKLAACTLKMCPPVVKPVPVSSVMDPSDPEFHCTPGQHLKIGVADTCICAKDGKHVMCTYGANVDDEFHCTPGQHFNIGIGNSCVCEEDGKHAACTISAVDYIDTPEEDPIHKCSPGEILRGKCNL